MSGLELVVTDHDHTPPYEQLRQQLVTMIGSGALAPGQRLPPLRQLAGDLGLAVGTVARTYKELESSGHVVSRRGAGTRVSATAGVRSRAQTMAELDARAREYVHEARLLNLDRAAIEAALTRALDSWDDARASSDEPSQD